uniref:Ubiquitin-specific protease family C19-related protein n=1 Tax=Leersia perrieri TaxID=77586 RepID=A0A0D9W952_9ORYZ
MGSRFPSHQLSNGLYVSGRPEKPKEKAPTICSAAMPYTGGDLKKSGELGKMFELHAVKSRKSGPLSNAPSRNASFGGAASNSGPVANAGDRSNYSGSLSSSVPGASGSARAKSSSGPLNKHGEPVKRSSGPQSGGVTPMARQHSGPLPPMLPATGLITSGPITSGPLNSSGAQRKVSGPLDSAASKKMRATSFSHNQAVTKITTEESFSITGSLSKLILVAVAVLFVLGLIAGVLILGAVHNAILLIVVLVLFGFVAALFIWNACWARRGAIGFVDHYLDADLRTAKDGQYIKVTGVVTCGNLPLESSYQRVPRCVYTSTTLHEYRGWDSKAANNHHRPFTWGLRSMEQHAVDFYISDFQSGLRALVKAGFGARVTPFVDESVVIDIDPDNKDRSPEFRRWLRERNLSSDDRIMRLKEGYIKEGSTVSVMGVVQKNDNVLMIVPPPEPISTGCQWAKCVLPRDLYGLVLRCEDTSNIDVIAV